MADAIIDAKKADGGISVEAVKGEKLTINKIAGLCGVSKTTISRYLNGKYDNMSEETRERIEAVIKQYDYHPNRSAQRLKAKNSMLIGCVIADVSSPFSGILLKGINDVCEEAGYQVLFADCHEDPEREKSVIQGFIENRVDGILVNTTGGNEDYLKEVRQLGTPIVLVDRLIGDEGFDSVSSPNFDTAKKCTEMLFDMGYDEVAFISERSKMISPRVDRRRGYTAAIEARGKRYESLEFSRSDPAECTDFIREFKDTNKGKRLAVLSVNGVTAQYVILSFLELGIKTGDAFGFCTFDDWKWLQLASPSVTTIELGTEEKGTSAARLLIDRINAADDSEPRAEHITVPSRIVIRDTTVYK